MAESTRSSIDHAACHTTCGMADRATCRMADGRSGKPRHPTASQLFAFVCLLVQGRILSDAGAKCGATEVTTQVITSYCFAPKRTPARHADDAASGRLIVAYGAKSRCWRNRRATATAAEPSQSPWRVWLPLWARGLAVPAMSDRSIQAPATTAKKSHVTSARNRRS